MKIKGWKLGSTGRFPYGKADANDEGELRMAVVTDHANAIVRIVFGKPVGWLGLPVQQARAFAAMLNEKSDELERRKA